METIPVTNIAETIQEPFYVPGNFQFCEGLSNSSTSNNDF